MLNNVEEIKSKVINQIMTDYLQVRFIIFNGSYNVPSAHYFYMELYLSGNAEGCSNSFANWCLPYVNAEEPPPFLLYRPIHYLLLHS